MIGMMAFLHGSAKAQSPSAFQPAFPVSLEARMFLMDLQREWTASGKALKQFTPSESLVAKYSLRPAHETYYVSALIWTDAPLKSRQLKKAGIAIVFLAGNICTIQIPIASLPVLLRQKGIIYLAISFKRKLN